MTAKNAEPRNSSTSPLRVLLLEDNPHDAKLTVANLQRQGYSVQFDVADTPATFQERLNKAEYDVVLADYNLTDWTAMEALEILKRSGKDIPLIVVTGSLGDEAAVECIKRGAADFVLKDRPARLPLAVRQALEEKLLRQERKRAEEALRESEDRYRDLVEHSQDLICTHDLEGRILSLNDPPARTLGYTREDGLGKNLRDILAPEVRAGFDEYLARIRRDGAASGLLKVLTKTGERRIWEYHNTLRTEGVAAPVVRGLAHDVTERLRAEKALRAGEVQYRAFFDNSLDAILLTSPNGSIYAANPAACEMLGRTESEICAVGRNGLLDATDPRLASLLQERGRTGKACGELTMLRADGTPFPVEVSSAIFRDADGNTRTSMIIRDITGRKRAEEALRESRESFKHLFENALLGLYRTTPDGTVVIANPALCQMLGYRSVEELKERNLEKNGFEASYPRSEFKKTLDEKGLIVGWEAIWTRADGTKVFVRESAKAIRDNSGKVLYYEGTVEDITERKRAEEALVKLRQAVNASGEVVFMTDREGVITFINPEFSRLYGYSEQEVVGKVTPRILKSDTMRPEQYASFWRTILSKQVARGELTNRAKDGRLVSVESSANPILDERGNIAGFLAIQRDITKRKRAEEALRISEQKFSKAFNASPEPVTISTLEEGIYIDVNERYLRATGFQREEVIGRSAIDVGFWEGAEDRARMLQLLERDGLVRDFEMTFGTKSGERRHGLLSADVIETGGHRWLLAITKDVTERTRLEEQFRQVQKMEAVGRLAGGVAHDFNNLLTIINGYSQLVHDRLEAQSPLRAQLAEIQKAGERAAGLTQQLLAFSRRQVLNPQVLDLSKVIQDTHKMLQRLIGEDIECRMVLHSQPWKVKADLGQIEQILMNLAVNARDAMPQGGQLTIETTNVNLDEEYARWHSDVTPGQYVALSVSDTGIGMGPETQARIFEPFFTTKEQGKGTGLGLATVYGIVKQSGGHIWVYSEPGKGTTFKVYLPRVEGEAEPSGPSKVRRPIHKGTETILLVEDEAAVRKLAAGILKANGYQVLVAADPEEATQICGQHPQHIHLLLTDVVMPKWSGRHLAEHLKFTRPDMKVLYMSGYTDDTIVQHGILQEGVPLLQKPFTPENLLRRVRGVLDG